MLLLTSYAKEVMCFDRVFNLLKQHRYNPTHRTSFGIDEMSIPTNKGYTLSTIGNVNHHGVALFVQVLNLRVTGRELSDPNIKHETIHDQCYR